MQWIPNFRGVQMADFMLSAKPNSANILRISFDSFMAFLTVIKKAARHGAAHNSISLPTHNHAVAKSAKSAKLEFGLQSNNKTNGLLLTFINIRELCLPPEFIFDAPGQPSFGEMSQFACKFNRFKVFASETINSSKFNDATVNQWSRIIMEYRK